MSSREQGLGWGWGWMQTAGAEGAPGFWVLLGKRDAVGTTRQRNHTALRKSSAKNSPAPGKERLPLPNSPSIPSSCLLVAMERGQVASGLEGTQEGHIHAWQLVGIGEVWEHPARAVQCFGMVYTSPSPPWWGRCWSALPPEAPQDSQLGVGEAEPAGLTAPGDGQMAGWRGRCVRGMDGRIDGWRD